MSEKEGMSKSEIYSHLDSLKSPAEKTDYIKRILKKEKLLKPGTRKELYAAATEIYEKENMPDEAAEMYQKSGMKKEEAYLNVAKDFEKEAKNPKSLFVAADAYSKAHEYEKAVELFKKVGFNVDAKKLQALDSAFAATAVFGGFGIIFSLFSRPKVITAQNIQLAPPLPNFMIYIFILFLLAGGSYFLMKYIRKRMGSVPLSF